MWKEWETETEKGSRRLKNGKKHEARKTEVAMGGPHYERHGKSGRRMEKRCKICRNSRLLIET